MPLPNDLAFAQSSGAGGTAVSFPAGAGKVQHGRNGTGGSFGAGALVDSTISGVDGSGQPAGFYMDGNFASVMGTPTRRLLEVRGP